MGAAVNRYVEDVNVYQADDRGNLRQTGRGVTHYRMPWVDTILGEKLRWELLDAGLPATVAVTYYPDSNELDIAIPGDDGGKLSAKIAKTLDKHKGAEAPEHVALVEFAGSIRDAAQRMAEGGEVSAAERDIVVGILAGRLA